MVINSHLSTLEAKEQIEAENKKMRELLSSFINDRTLCDEGYDEKFYCTYCYGKSQHEDDCIVVKAKALLEESKNEL